MPGLLKQRDKPSIKNTRLLLNLASYFRHCHTWRFFFVFLYIKSESMIRESNQSGSTLEWDDCPDGVHSSALLRKHADSRAGAVNHSFPCSHSHLEGYRAGAKGACKVFSKSLCLQAKKLTNLQKMSWSHTAQLTHRGRMFMHIFSTGMLQATGCSEHLYNTHGLGWSRWRADVC